MELFHLHLPLDEIRQHTDSFRLDRRTHQDNLVSERQKRRKGQRRETLRLQHNHHVTLHAGKTIETGQRHRGKLQRLQDLLLLVLLRNLRTEAHAGVSNSTGLQNVKIGNSLMLLEIDLFRHSSAIDRIRLLLPAHHAVRDPRHRVQRVLAAAHKHDRLLPSLRNAGGDVGSHLYHSLSEDKSTCLIGDVGATVHDAKNTLDAARDDGTLLRIDLDVLALRHGGL